MLQRGKGAAATPPIKIFTQMVCGSGSSVVMFQQRIQDAERWRLLLLMWLLLLLFTESRKRRYAIKTYLGSRATKRDTICHKNATLHFLLPVLYCCCFCSIKVEKGGVQLKCISSLKLNKWQYFQQKMQHCSSCCLFFAVVATLH